MTRGTRAIALTAPAVVQGAAIATSAVTVPSLVITGLLAGFVGVLIVCLFSRWIYTRSST